MHHTDYEHNLRQTKHTAAKKLATNAISGNSTQKNRTNPLSAIVAAMLVVAAILQMDPANAEPTMDMPGYATLHFTDNDQSIWVMALARQL